MLPASECQQKEEDEAEGLAAFHLYLLGAADFLGLASKSALGCGFTRSAAPQEAVHVFSAAALGLRALRGARGLFAEAATHL